MHLSPLQGCQWQGGTATATHRCSCSDKQGYCHLATDKVAAVLQRACRFLGRSYAQACLETCAALAAAAVSGKVATALYELQKVSPAELQV